MQVLIDGGRGGAVLPALGREMGFFDRGIDVVLATHPDLDHIGGLIDVLERYKVATIMMTENESDTPAAELFKTRVQEEGANVVYVRRGEIIDLGGGVMGSTTLTILFPDRDPTHFESNASSIISRLTYGSSEFLFTGDAPKEIEEYLVSLGTNTLASDVLKVGHHGSRTSTSEVFLSAVAPGLAIISAGKDNTYGHPHKEVVERLEAYGATQKNTADSGSIFLLSDGVTIWSR
jgi:competence protein ComEC